MIGKLYNKEFIKKENLKNMESVVNKILRTEEAINKNCIDWNSNDIEEFLKDFHSVSPNTLSRGYNIFKKFVKYICDKEELPIPHEEQELEYGIMYDLVDYNKIMETTITPWDYMNIKNQIDLNIRDKVTFELAWNFLTMEEIKYLKESDIEFVENPENGLDMAFLNIEDKVIKIEDPETVEDIRKCMKEQYYNSTDKNGTIKRYAFRDSNYLIKPAVVGRTKTGEEMLSNPSEALRKTFETQHITCGEINMDELTVESIRRSSIICLLTDDNKKYFDFDFISTILGGGDVQSILFWLREIAKIKYKK